MKALTFVSALILSALMCSNASAQNNIFNMIESVMRDAAVNKAKKAWSRVSPIEVACLESALHGQGTSINQLISNGVRPNDASISGIRQQCKNPYGPAADPPGLSSLSEKPTFDCSKAKSATGRIICMDREGAGADWNLISASWAARFTLPQSDRQTFDKAEEAWLLSLNNHCDIGSTQLTFSSAQRKCVMRAYADRTNEYRSHLKRDALEEADLSPEKHQEIQKKFIAMGLLKGEADGEFGEDTRAAIRAFRSRSGETEADFLTTGDRIVLLAAAETHPSSAGTNDRTADSNDSSPNTDSLEPAKRRNGSAREQPIPTQVETKSARPEPPTPLLHGKDWTLDADSLESIVSGASGTRVIQALAYDVELGKTFRISIPYNDCSQDAVELSMGQADAIPTDKINTQRSGTDALDILVRKLCTFGSERDHASPATTDISLSENKPNIPNIPSQTAPPVKTEPPSTSSTADREERDYKIKQAADSESASRSIGADSQHNEKPENENLMLKLLITALSVCLAFAIFLLGRLSKRSAPEVAIQPALQSVPPVPKEHAYDVVHNFPKDDHEQPTNETKQVASSEEDAGKNIIRGTNDTQIKKDFQGSNEKIISAQDLLFSFEGRIQRSQYWQGVAFCGGSMIAVTLATLLVDPQFFQSGPQQLSSAAVGIFFIGMTAVLYVSWAVGAKRCHDRNLSGWHQLIGLVPVIGAIFLVIELGMLDGDTAPNRFGRRSSAPNTNWTTFNMPAAIVGMAALAIGLYVMQPGKLNLSIFSIGPQMKAELINRPVDGHSEITQIVVTSQDSAPFLIEDVIFNGNDGCRASGKSSAQAEAAAGYAMTQKPTDDSDIAKGLSAFTKGIASLVSAAFNDKLPKSMNMGSQFSYGLGLPTLQMLPGACNGQTLVRADVVTDRGTLSFTW